MGLCGFYAFLSVSYGFQGRNKGKENPRKRQTNQGKFKEAISSQNASIMPVTKGTARININIYIYNVPMYNYIYNMYVCIYI